MTVRARLYLDLALFGAVFAAYNPAWTGLAVHEWVSVAAIVPLLFHVVVNWDQTLRILRRFAEIVRATPKLNLVVDAALFVAAVAVMLSGLMVSQAVAGAIGVTIVPSSLWITVHSISADATIALLLAHFLLHWRWIVNVACKLGRPPRTLRAPTDPMDPIRVATARLATSPAHTDPVMTGQPHRL
jgi:hypothetical protein